MLNKSEYTQKTKQSNAWTKWDYQQRDRNYKKNQIKILGWKTSEGFNSRLDQTEKKA